MARLLYLQSSTAALDFARTGGLPIEDDAIIMKAAPVSTPDASELAWSRQEDSFVFGGNKQDWKDSRVDDEGVLIPPTSLLKSLIDSCK